MTQPGFVHPPAPGWWVRTNHIGVAETSHQWSVSARGANHPVSTGAGMYRWAGTSIGLMPVPVFSSVGVPFNGTANPLSNSYSAVSGADVLVATVCQFDGAAPTVTATYGGSSMTQVGTVNLNNNSLKGKLVVFRAAGAGNASTQTISITSGGGFYQMACAISYTGVASVSAAQTSFGISTTPSNTVTNSPSGVILNALGNQGFQTMFSPTGGTSRAFGSGVAGNGQSLALREANVTTAFGATLTAGDAWGGVGIILFS